MTRFKSELKNVDVKEVVKQTSKRGNQYLILKSIYNNDEINFYFPNSDSNLDIEALKGTHTLDVEITISRFSNVKILKVR